MNKYTFTMRNGDQHTAQPHTSHESAFKALNDAGVINAPESAIKSVVCRAILEGDMITVERPKGFQVGKSPMAQKYINLKAENSEYILFYRMGDFYEVLFDDAKAVSKALDIALTKRGELDGEPIPMVGIPRHTSKAWFDRLTRQGFKLAICEND
ncbi:hypothetical protein KAR91_51845 [Candidatus Pacearchaeota archaeon]|nr:hypothetical protein [Candidatus Pacearchaeota archaeon]